MADFTKPLHTQSSDEIIELINDKIEALATLSLNDGTWTNVPVGSVAFDSVTNEFKRKTGADTWSTVQLSLGSNSSLTLGSLTIIDALNAPQITSLNSRVADLEASSITFSTGTDGDDFNIEDLQNISSGNVERKQFNLPDASATARGALTTTAQIIGGTKTFASGTIKLGNSSTQSHNWSLSSGQTLTLLSGNTTRAVVDSNGQVGVGALTPNNVLHLKSSNTTTGITLEDSVGQTQISSSDRAITIQAAKIKLSIENSPVITVDNSEKVGIGTETPSEKLDVSGTITTSAAFTLKNKGCSIQATDLAGDTTNSSDLTLTAANSTNSILLRAAQNIKLQTYSAGSYQERITILNNGNVGIGTADPGARLHVFGSAQVDGGIALKAGAPVLSLIDVGISNSSQSAFLTSDSGIFYILRGIKGSSTWTQNSTGYWPLQINLNTNEFSVGGSINLPNTSSRLGLRTSTTSHVLDVRNNAGFCAAITRYSPDAGTTDFYLRKSRGSSINQNTIVANTDAVGALYFQGANGTQATNGSEFSTCAMIVGRVSGTPTSSSLPGQLEFYTADNSGAVTERLRVDNAGNVSIGAVTAGCALDVYRSQDSSACVRVRNHSNTAGGSSAYILGNATSSDAAYLGLLSPTSPNRDIYGAANNSPNWVYLMHRLWTGGIATGTRNVLRNQTTDAGDFIPSAHHNYSCGWYSMGWAAVYSAYYGVSSDARIKNTITECTLGLDFINKLKARSYKMNVGGYDVSAKDGKEIRIPRPGIRTHHGFIAQEVKEALGDVDSAIWEAGDKNDSESPQSLKINEFLAPIVKAIQELSAKVDTLQAEVNELKAKG